MKNFIGQSLVVAFIFCFYVLAFAATPVLTQDINELNAAEETPALIHEPNEADAQEVRRLETTTTMSDLIPELSRAQLALMSALSERAALESTGPKIFKRGYMNLVSQLDRVALSNAARTAAIAQAQAAAAAAAAAAASS